MNNIKYQKSFLKDFKKLDSKIKKRFIEKQKIFLNDNFDQILKNHALSGEWDSFRSINITGDFRAIYFYEDGYIYFVRIGSHNQLYKKF